MNNKTQKIENVLFDLGNVMVYLDYARTLREFTAFMQEPDSEVLELKIRGMLKDQVEFESGMLSGEEFFRIFVEKSGISVGYRHFRIIWLNLFRPVWPMIRLAGYLSRNFNIYYFSNTNEIHVPALYDICPEMKVHKGDALSHELGTMKPDQEFFTRGFARLGIDPHHSVFFDDLPANVEAACLCGLDAYVHESPEKTVSILQQLLAARNRFDIPEADTRRILDGK
jgi:putative hydrolase of the HAD superfamily